jgi:hypothetical protein
MNIPRSAKATASERVVAINLGRGDFLRNVTRHDRAPAVSSQIDEAHDLSPTP